MDGTLVKVIGLVAGGCTSCALIPQVVKTIKTKKASDVSIFMFVVMLTGNSLWTVYGFRKNDLAIILTNLFTVGLNLIMLFLKLKYKDHP